jgi:hypothetical protein
LLLVDGMELLHHDEEELLRLGVGIGAEDGAHGCGSGAWSTDTRLSPVR